MKLRDEIRNAIAEHKAFVAMERAELDDAGYRSLLYPMMLWTLIADGATQRNFVLPKLRQRWPKELARSTFFASKLYGVYLYGYGVNCYVVHESVGGGANLACTCIYLTLLDALEAGRPPPEELQFNLDNTTSENKCVTMFMFAGWLVLMGYVKRIRIFFLPKGHTHVIIDQVYGRITKYIGLEAFTLCQNSLTPSKKSCIAARRSKGAL